MLDFVLSFIFGLLMAFMHLFVDAGPEARAPRPSEIASAPNLALRTTAPSALMGVSALPKPAQFAQEARFEKAPTETEASKADAEHEELFNKLKRLNPDAPLKKQDLDDLDAFYDEVGAYVDPKELQDLLKKDPKNLDELRDLVQKNEEEKWGETRKRETELMNSLKNVDFKKPLLDGDMERIYELQDIYGLQLSEDEVKGIMAQGPKDVEDFLDKAFELEGQYED